MKRIVTLSLFTFLLSSTIISQKTDNNCSHKDLIRGFVNIADSISRFMDNTKAVVGDAGWEAFINAAQNMEGEKAFDHFGELGESVKTTLNDLGYQLSGQMQKLNLAIRIDDKMTDADVKEIIDREIYCYFLDTVENNLAKLLQAAGKLAPDELGTLGDPCEDAFRGCMGAASAAHSSGLNNCLSIAGTGGGIFGWLGGVLSGLGCLGSVENTFNRAKIRCLDNFMDCIKH